MRLSLATLYTLGECGDENAREAWEEWIRLSTINDESFAVHTHYLNGKYDTRLHWKFKFQRRST